MTTTCEALRLCERAATKTVTWKGETFKACEAHAADVVALSNAETRRELRAAR